MEQEILTDTETLLIRRMTLPPGAAGPWHSDRCHRFSVIVSGDALEIEYRDNESRHRVVVHAGMAGWDAPDARVHRAINVGDEVYEEVVTFYRDGVTGEPQPLDDAKGQG
ncbi:MAG: hypothetical protein AAF513_11710 [Pseudomonadota bacterium]